MEIGFRSVRVLNRLLRRPIGFASYKSAAAGAAVKEEVNSELLNQFNQDIKDGN